MIGLSESHVPREIDDPAVRAALRAEYAYAERLRAAIVGWTAAATGVIVGTAAMLGSLGVGLPAAPAEGSVMVAVGAGLLLAAVQYGISAWTVDVRDTWARSALWYGAAVLEIGVIVGAWALVGAAGGVRSLIPGLTALAALVALSALRLDWRLTACTAALAAAGHIALSLHLGSGDVQAGFRPRAFDGAVLLVVIGGLSALVAEQARRRTMQALLAITEQQRLERDILIAEDAARGQIGRDLHDGLGGRLTALALMATGLARRAEGGTPVPLGALREVATLALEGVEEVRRLSRGLDPAPVALGLPEALARLAERTTAAGTPCSFIAEGDTLALEGPSALQLYHIALEATSNALRHGAPTQIDLRLTTRPSTISLDVRDDGRGIPAAPVAGLGLRTMAQRAALLGAVLRVRPGPHGGTLVSCVLPR